MSIISRNKQITNDVISNILIDRNTREARTINNRHSLKVEFLISRDHKDPIERHHNILDMPVLELQRSCNDLTLLVLEIDRLSDEILQRISAIFDRQLYNT